MAALLTLTAAPFAEGAEKIFVHALEGEPESLDFAKTTTERANRVAWLMSDTLVNISKDGKSLEPGLAQSWTISPDGLQVVMKLRSGVTFHDGTALDARSVKDSFERQFRKGHPLYSDEPKNAKEALLNDLIEGIDTRDGLTLAFKLKHPGLHYLSQVEVASPTAVAKLGKGFAQNPVYTGPFKFESRSQDQIVLTANDRYWGGRPRIDRLVFRSIPDGRAVVDALLKGEVDFVPVLPDPTLFERVRESPRLKLAQVPGLNVFYLGFYTERPPLNNVQLRRAVVQGVNVQRTATFLGRGVAVAAKGPLSPAMKGYDPSVSQASHDPQAAKESLDKAGLGNALSLRLIYNSAVTFDAEMVGAIQNDLRQIGIKVEPLGKPNFSEVVKAVRAREGDMFMYSWHVRAPYPERVLLPLFHSRSAGTSNLTNYKNPNLDRMLDEVLRLPEGPEQARLYSQIQKVIVDDAPMVFLYHSTRMAAYADRVLGLELNLGALPFDKLVKVDLAQ
ncbi:MAG TPA: ABC transporter substrate-binding protein [Candidatus Methylomirabilis sp.]|nr:ABC transporter substrate-binding protein [Candidatus Methylomirabilis sp.]